MSAAKTLLESLYFEVIPMKGFEEKLDVLKAGDRVGITCSPKQGLQVTLDTVAKLSDRFDNLTGQEVNPDKTVGSCSREERTREQMAEVRVRGSKFGPALVVQTTKSSGDYALGFRVDPEDRSGPARELLGAGRSAHRVTRAQAGRGDAGDHVAPPDLRAGARLRRGRVREEGGARGGRRGARTRAEISRRGPRRVGLERRAGENASRTTSRSWAAAARTTTPSWPPTTRTPGASPKKTSCTTPIWAWRSRSSRPGSPRSRCGSSRFMIKFSVVFDSAPGVARAPPSAPRLPPPPRPSPGRPRPSPPACRPSPSAPATASASAESGPPPSPAFASSSLLFRFIAVIFLFFAFDTHSKSFPTISNLSRSGVVALSNLSNLSSVFSLSARVVDVDSSL